jgi:hypothetical protein
MPEKVLVFYNHLVETYEDSQDFKVFMTNRIGVYCVFILELVGIIIDDGVFHERNQKTPSMILISSKYAKDIFSIPY